MQRARNVQLYLVASMTRPAGQDIGFDASENESLMVDDALSRVEVHAVGNSAPVNRNWGVQAQQDYHTLSRERRVEFSVVGV